MFGTARSFYLDLLCASVALAVVKTYREFRRNLDSPFFSPFYAKTAAL
jgi:hypothetical protein